jgi:hypothetical protein
VQDTSGTATDIDYALALSDADFLELCVRIRGKVGDLTLQPHFFGFGPSKQVDIGLCHGWFPQREHI